MRVEYNERADKFTITLTRMGVLRILGGLYFLSTIVLEESDWSIPGGLRMFRNQLRSKVEDIT